VLVVLSALSESLFFMQVALRTPVLSRFLVLAMVRGCGEIRIVVVRPKICATGFVVGRIIERCAV